MKNPMAIQLDSTTWPTHTIIKSLVNKFAMKRYLLSDSELPVLSKTEKISNTPIQEKYKTIPEMIDIRRLAKIVIGHLTDPLNHQELSPA